VSYRVLVVDDSAVVRAMVRKAVAMTGLEVQVPVLEAGDGCEALEVLRREPVDLVFTDLHMPRMSGAELVDRLAADPALRRVPVVMVSSDRDEGRAEALAARGVRAWVSKPFRPEAFRDAVREALGGGGDRAR
jgi:two-component system chemotaxis response regulator CheY